MIAERDNVPKDRQIILSSNSIEFGHSLKKLGFRLASQHSTDIHSSIDHKIARTKHESGNAWYGSNLFGILKTLERFDLWDETNVVVCSLDVVRVIWVQGFGQAGGEGPWGE